MLLFIDSFDHYATADIARKWTQIYTGAGNTSPAITASVGRRSSAAMRWAASFRGRPAGIVLPASGATCIVGFAFTTSGLALAVGSQWDLTSDGSGGQEGPVIMGVRQSTVPHVYFRLNTDGTINAYRAGNSIGSSAGILLGTTSAALSPGTSAFLEFKVTISNTVGVVTIKKDGVTILSLTGQDTNNGTGTDAWTEVAIGRHNGTGTTINWDYDDLYICDGSGSAFNNFVGDCRVDARVPTGAGATTGWTPNTGANYAAVDDSAPDDDTTYVAAATTPLTDTYVVQDAPVSGAAPLAVQAVLLAKKTDAGTCTVAPVVRHSGTDNVGSDLSPSTTYAFLRQVYEQNPGIAGAWTESDFNAAEFGIKRTA